jgi:hypothetical protein
LSRTAPVAAPSRPTLWFVVRFLVIVTLLRLGYPLVARGYKAAFGAAANVVLAAFEPGGTIELRFEPFGVVPGRDEARMAVLRARDRVFGQEARLHVDVRSFSYRPMATFVALFLAYRWKDRRRAAIVGSVGIVSVALLSSALTAVATLRFGLGKVLGIGDGRLLQMTYEALTTPVMIYALPIFIFWALVRLSRWSALVSTAERA